MPWWGACMVDADGCGCVRLVCADETYFMYGEDLDWCYASSVMAGRLCMWLMPSCIMSKRASSRQQPVQTIHYFYDAMRIFFRRYYAATTPTVICWVIETGITLKEQVSLARNYFRPPRPARRVD